MDIDQLERMSDLRRVKSLFRVARQRDQTMPARLKTFKALVGDPVDRPAEKPLFVEPCEQPNFLEARDPPTQRAHDYGEHLVGQELAELIETKSARIPDMKQDRHIACFGERNIAFVIPHWSAPSRTTLNRIRHWLESTCHRPTSLSTQSWSPKSNIASSLEPRKLIEMGVTPADFHPGLPNSMAPCSQDRSVTRYASGSVWVARRSKSRCIFPANWRGDKHLNVLPIARKGNSGSKPLVELKRTWPGKIAL